MLRRRMPLVMFGAGSHNGNAIGWLEREKHIPAHLYTLASKCVELVQSHRAPYENHPAAFNQAASTLGNLCVFVLLMGWSPSRAFVVVFVITLLHKPQLSCEELSWPKLSFDVRKGN